MRVAERVVQKRVALAFAHLCSPDDLRTIFIDNNGMSHPLYLNHTFHGVFLHRNLYCLYIYVDFEFADIYNIIKQGWSCFLGFLALLPINSSLMLLWLCISWPTKP